MPAERSSLRTRRFSFVCEHHAPVFGAGCLAKSVKTNARGRMTLPADASKQSLGWMKPERSELPPLYSLPVAPIRRTMLL